MANTTDQLVDSFASKLKLLGVPIRGDDNSKRLVKLEAELSKRLPQSFESLLSRYSFPEFDACGIAFFDWESSAGEIFEVASSRKGSLPEVMLRLGFFQIGRPDTGSFNAICFDETQKSQNREYRIVQVDHEEILCNSRLKIVRELWPSFRKLMEYQLSQS